MTELKIASDRIYNQLVINSPYIENLSLEYGLTGLSIYFYIDHVVSNRIASKEIAERLLSPLERLLLTKATALPPGLASAGCGVEYLSQLKLCNNAPVYALHQLDFKIFHEIANISSENLNVLITLGKYLKLRYQHVPNATYLEFLVHLIDKILKFYSKLNNRDYIPSIIDIKCLMFLEWCKENSINTFTSEVVINKIEDAIKSQADYVNPIIKLSWDVCHNQNFGEFNFSKFEFSNDCNQLKDELALLLLISKSTGMYIAKVRTGLMEFISKTNPVFTSIVGLNKIEPINYSLNGLAGWGILLLSALTDFKDLRWLELFF